MQRIACLELFYPLLIVSAQLANVECSFYRARQAEERGNVVVRVCVSVYDVRHKLSLNS